MRSIYQHFLTTTRYKSGSRSERTAKDEKTTFRLVLTSAGSHFVMSSLAVFSFDRPTMVNA